MTVIISSEAFLLMASDCHSVTPHAPASPVFLDNGLTERDIGQSWGRGTGGARTLDLSFCLDSENGGSSRLPRHGQ